MLPYVPVLAALTLVAGVTMFLRPLTRPEMLAACVIVLYLLARQYLALWENARLARELSVRERQIRRQAFTDALTGLPNRALFLDRLEHSLALNRRDRRPVAAVFIDLDNFKVVNDTLGHAAGDALLAELARRVSATVRVGDTADRLGGDEFAMLLEDATAPLTTIDRIHTALSAPFDLAGFPHTARASLSVAEISAADEAVSADELLARADAAMYAAKRAGRTTGTSTVACFPSGSWLDPAAALTVGISSLLAR